MWLQVWHEYFLHACEVLLACRWHLFPGANIEERLEHAYGSFHSWCVAEKKGSSLQRFELKTFKMTSCLGLCVFVCPRAGVCVVFLMCPKNDSNVLFFRYIFPGLGHSKTWPSRGKLSGFNDLVSMNIVFC